MLVLKHCLGLSSQMVKTITKNMRTRRMGGDTTRRFTSPPRSATMPALKVGDLPLPLHLVHADLTCHQNENKHV